MSTCVTAEHHDTAILSIFTTESQDIAVLYSNTAEQKNTLILTTENAEFHDIAIWSCVTAEIQDSAIFTSVNAERHDTAVWIISSTEHQNTVFEMVTMQIITIQQSKPVSLQNITIMLS